jgi:hypothetical protein
MSSVDEQAALVAERDELRAEVERLREGDEDWHYNAQCPRSAAEDAVARLRALAGAFADDGMMRHGGNIAWHIEEAIANEKGDFPDAADRRIASQRERAESAEAKVARVYDICREVEANPVGWGGPMAVSLARTVRAALADPPAETTR